MKKWTIMICSIGLLPMYANGQNWQSAISLDSRVGYTTNTYLNPFLSEWDRSVDGGYMFFSPIGQLAYNTGKISAEFAAGAVYTPFFDERDAWSGAFSTAGINYRFNHRLSAGISGGGSYFSTVNPRQIYWLQPGINWSAGTFTQIRLKAGPSFRKLEDELIDEEQDFIRFSSYSVELETWRGFQWQLRASVFGSLDDPAGNSGLRGSADYRRSRKWQFSMRVGLEQFQFQSFTDPGNGGPPIGGPAPGGEDFTEETDRIFRAGIGSTYRVTSKLALNVNADHLRYFSTAAGESLSDFHLSAGIQYSMFPGLGRQRGATAEWRQNDSQVVLLKLNYSGDGQLYILGDFNDWKQPGIPLSRQKRNRYAVELSLDAGAHEYKILLIEADEQKWIEFSDDTYTVSDGFGGVNGLIFID